MVAISAPSWLQKVRVLRVRRSSSVLYATLWALFAVAIMLLIARLVWTIFTPVSVYGDWQPARAEIADPASRALLFARFDPFNRSAPVTANAGPTEVTSLQLTLFGIRINRASGTGSAIIANEEGLQRSYNVGEDIMSGVTLQEVAFDHVILSRNGSNESLYLDQSVPAETVSGGNGAIDESGVLRTNPPSGISSKDVSLSADSIRKSVSFAPRLDDGQITGLAVSPRGDGAIFNAAGFKSGDIISTVNGNPVTSAGDIARLTQQLAPGARISVEVERGASKVPLAIVIPDS